MVEDKEDFRQLPEGLKEIAEEFRERNRERLESLNFEEDKVYVVLGMHRSGTSFIAKSLYDQGVDMGTAHNMLGPNEWNKLGHYENVGFVSVNDDVLLSCGGAWNNPVGKKCIKEGFEEQRDRVESLIEDNRSSFWGWKDPRNTLTIDGWLPYLDGDVYLVATFRKPSKIAHSLYKRQGVPPSIGEELTKQYYREFIKTLKDFLEL